MNAPLQTQSKVTAASQTAFSVVPTGLLQRKCERAGGAASVADQAEASGVPPIVHEVLHSPGQPLDSTTPHVHGAALWARL